MENIVYWQGGRFDSGRHYLGDLAQASLGAVTLDVIKSALSFARHRMN